MPDFNKLSQKMGQVEAKRVERAYLGTGTHVVQVEAVLTKETQTGKEICIIESKIVSSTGAHVPGEYVKQIFAVSNDLAWRIDQNISLLKAMIRAGIDIASPDPTQLEAAMTGGAESSLAGSYLKIIAVNQTSKNGKAYIDFSYVKPESSELNAPAVQSAAPTTAQAPEVLSEDIPDFDV
tara:strand:+ start:20881 stop:21420 length:540 start_codon:yes stop_codon:yes gene_type:complete